MAISKVVAFNWEKTIASVGTGSGLRSLLQLRGKANEIASNHAKFTVSPAPLDFQGYKKKLKFVGSSVDALEKLYANRKLPKYTATLPEFETKKRVAVVATAKAISDAAEADLVNIAKLLEVFDANRFTDDSTFTTVANRFPHLAREVDAELNDQDWLNENNKTA